MLTGNGIECWIGKRSSASPISSIPNDQQINRVEDGITVFQTTIRLRPTDRGTGLDRAGKIFSLSTSD
jgi:hypothetical protein